MPKQPGLRNRLLNHYDRPKHARKPIIACDIETTSIGRGTADERDFKIGAFVGEGETQPTYFYSPDEWVAHILARHNEGQVWYCHNGGEFDYKYLLDALRRYQRQDPKLKFQPITQGNSGRMIGIVMRRGHHRTELRDSFALVSSSLEKFAGQYSAGAMKLKGKIDFSTEEFDPSNPDHMSYLDNDVLSLRDALLGFFKIVDEYFDVDCAWTIAATAMRAWRHMLPRSWGFWRQRREVETLCRDAYYGGLVFLTGIGVREDAVAVDVNSMYPYVMRAHGVPTGTGIWVGRRNRHRPGFYRVRVHCPEEVVFTCIPLRDTKTNSICWPTGDFETTISSVDWDLAEPLGYSFEVVEGIEFEQIEHIFDPFVNTCEKLRTSHERGSAVEAAAKIFQNGLYGKFGSAPIGKTTLVSADEEDKTPYVNPITGELVDGLYESEEIMDVPYIQPHWAAWITSQARAHLVRLVLAIGPEQVYYGDTDSITADRKAIESAIASGTLSVGSAYGQVKIEHEYERFTARAPKLYVGIEKGGKPVVKAKGIPKKVAAPDHVIEFFEKQTLALFEPVGAHRERLKHASEGYDPTTGVFVFDSMNATMSVLKLGRAFYERRIRTLSNIEHSKGWRVVDNTTGRVRPVHVTEVPDPSSESG